MAKSKTAQVISVEDRVKLAERALTFNAQTAPDWYWIREDQTLFHSGRIATVDQDDGAYQTWRSLPAFPTPYPKDENGAESVDELQKVLDPFNLHATLEHYAGGVRYAAEVGGIDVAGAQVATDRGSQALINGAFNLVQVKPDTIVQFKAAGGFTQLDAATVTIIATEVGEHVQACFAKEAEVLGKIADGTIATKAKVDTAFKSLLP